MPIITTSRQFKDAFRDVHEDLQNRFTETALEALYDYHDEDEARIEMNVLTFIYGWQEAKASWVLEQHDVSTFEELTDKTFGIELDNGNILYRK